MVVVKGISRTFFFLSSGLVRAICTPIFVVTSYNNSIKVKHMLVISIMLNICLIQDENLNTMRILKKIKRSSKQVEEHYYKKIIDISWHWTVVGFLEYLCLSRICNNICFDYLLCPWPLTLKLEGLASYTLNICSRQVISHIAYIITQKNF